MFYGSLESFMGVLVKESEIRGLFWVFWWRGVKGGEGLGGSRTRDPRHASPRCSLSSHGVPNKSEGQITDQTRLVRRPSIGLASHSVLFRNMLIS